MINILQFPYKSLKIFFWKIFVIGKDNFQRFMIFWKVGGEEGKRGGGGVLGLKIPEYMHNSP